MTRHRLDRALARASIRDISQRDEGVAAFLLNEGKRQLGGLTRNIDDSAPCTLGCGAERDPRASSHELGIGCAGSGDERALPRQSCSRMAVWHRDPPRSRTHRSPALRTPPTEQGLGFFIQLPTRTPDAAAAVVGFCSTFTSDLGQNPYGCPDADTDSPAAAVGGPSRWWPVPRVPRPPC